MTKIALLCPTRGRPEQFKRMCESAWATSKERPQIYAYRTPDDEAKYPDLITHMHIGPDYPTVHKWNFLAERAMQGSDTKLFMLAADDIVFSTPGWQEALIESYNSLDNKIHCWHLRDSRNLSGVPHPIVSREWIDAMGWFIPPYFLHWKCDVWTNEIAKANNCFTHLDGFLLIHAKPSDTGDGDDTHQRIRRLGWLDRDLYVANQCEYILEAEKQRLYSAILKQNLRGNFKKLDFLPGASAR